MPGGQSASVLGASFDVLDRSTGTSSSVGFTVGVVVVVLAGGVEGFDSLESGLRIFSMEKERCLGAAGVDTTVSAACSRSVGVGGGEVEFMEGGGEHRLEVLKTVEAGEEERWLPGENRLAEVVEAGDSRLAEVLCRLAEGGSVFSWWVNRSKWSSD